jgi:hypothetical protein
MQTTSGVVRAFQIFKIRLQEPDPLAKLPVRMALE